jgi:acyl-Coa thioesterase superfamily protein/acyl-CoA thioesterase superfamily protein
MAFYLQEAADRFSSTELTRGPWDAGAQHGGPPSALAGHLVESRDGARDDMRVTRMTVELMRPVPIAPLNATTRTVHSGRSVEVVEVTLTPDGGKPVLRATAQRIRVAADDDLADEPVAVLPTPDEADPRPFEFPFDVGYHTALESRFVAGAFRQAGPATCWTRLTVPVVAGVPTSPLSRVLAAADSGNGISNVLDFDKYLFVNPDLSVVLHRYPAGEWVALDARTTLGEAGIAVADTALHDERGPIGRGLQSLFVARR